MESSVELININEVCRMCLKKCDGLYSIADVDVINIQETLSIEILDEEKQHYICVVCFKEIQHWRDFKRKAVEAFLLGRQLLEEMRQIETLQIEKNQHNSTADLNNIQLVIINSSNNCNSEEKQSKCNTSPGESLKKCECVKCGKIFKRLQSLSDHMKRHYDKRNFVCETCGKRFYKQYNVTEHMRIHTGERPFKCEYCDKTFTRGLLLRNHIKKIHIGDKKYICGFCSKSFVDAYQLKIHLRIHTGEKPFACKDCSKKFAMSSQLRSHIKYKHTKIKDFICNICAKAFTAKHTLNEHMRTHTGMKREPRHECGICGKKCLTTSQLKIHIKSQHTGERPFSCDLCSKKFVTNSGLEVHLKTHKGEKNFICEQCGKAFSARSTLKTHTRIHTGEKPFECELCAKSFTQSSTLRTHMKIHMSDNN